MATRRGVLMRTIPVRLVNVSSSGFLVESREPIDAGTPGILDVDADGVRYLSPAHLLRSVQKPGAGQTFQLGGIFAPSVSATRRATTVPRPARVPHRASRRTPRQPQPSAA